MSKMGMTGMKGVAGMFLTALVFVCYGGSAHAETPEVLQGCMGLDHSVTKSDGSILAIGTSNHECASWPTASGPGLLTMVQLKPDGSVDPGFANGGVKTFPELGSKSPLRLFAAAGNKSVIVLNDRLIRLNPDGSDDPAFGSGGSVPVTAGPTGPGPLADAAMQADGKLVVVGSKMARFHTSGELDEEFGTGGVVDASGSAIAVDPDGHVVIGSGYSDGWSDNEIIAERFDSAGNRDLAFGGDGDGIAKAPPYVVSKGAVRRIYIEQNGEIRLYGNGTCASLYCTIDYVSVIDPEGLPLPALSGSLPGGGGKFAEDSEGNFAVTFGSSRLERPQFRITGPGDQGEDWNPASFKPTPGEASSFGIDFSAFDGSFVAVGQADYGNCWFCGPTQMMVAKIDAVTRKPDPGFGVGGVALIPENTCRYGKGPSLPNRSTPWNRCLLKRPKLTATVKVRGGKQRPWLSIKGKLAGADKRPYLIGSRVTVTLPKRLRLNRWAGKRLFGKAGKWDLSLRGRKLTIRNAPSGSYDPFYDPEPSNPGTKFSFGLRPGALKPIGRKLQRKRPAFVVAGTHFATDGYEPASATYFAPNSVRKLIRTRLVRQQAR